MNITVYIWETSGVNNHNTLDTLLRYALSSTYDRNPNHCYINFQIGHTQMSI
jgi:hypothetical protein